MVVYYGCLYSNRIIGYGLFYIMLFHCCSWLYARNKKERNNAESVVGGYYFL